MKTSFLIIPALFVTIPMSIFGQGSLTPPGAPAPTMKTLDQVESRTIVNATNTPGNSSYAFVISQPGSYYLTRNFSAVDTKGGISITSGDVTLDLNGFTLDGAGLSQGAGISTNSSSNASNVTIRNGKVANWGKDGISAPFSVQVSIEKLQCDGNGYFAFGSGINVGLRSHLMHCSATGNSGIGIAADAGSNVSDCETGANRSYGIYLYSGIVAHCTSYSDNGGIWANTIGSSVYPVSVVGCTVFGSTTNGISSGNNVTIERCSVGFCAGVGISTGTGSTLRGCTVAGNSGNGFNVGDNSTVVDCTATASTGSGTNGFSCGKGVTLSNCTASGNPGNGIVLGDHSTAQNCVASGNTGDGITATVECSILSCNACGNTGNGIHLLGGNNSNNRVDGNNASNNTAIGILQHGGPDLIVRNMARSNGSGTNYSPSSGTSVGPIGTPNTATSPWANFQ